MKKYLILFLIIGIANSYAGPPKRNLDTERMIDNFNNWLSKNGHSQYLEIRLKVKNVNLLKKMDHNWYHNNL